MQQVRRDWGSASFAVPVSRRLCVRFVLLLTRQNPDLMPQKRATNSNYIFLLGVFAMLLGPAIDRIGFFLLDSPTCPRVTQQTLQTTVAAG